MTERDGEYLCEIENRHGRGSCDSPDCGSAGESAELPSRSTCFRVCPKGDKMELIIQKAVELGVYADRAGRDEPGGGKAG